MKTRYCVVFFSTLFILTACGSGQPEPPNPASVAPSPTSAPPTDVPTVRASVASIVSVSSDGSGDYPSLEEAVGGVAAWSTINLGEGTYRLEETLEIDKPLTLIGAGVDKTILVGNGKVAVIRYEGDELLTVRDLALRHEGELAAGVAVIQSGEVSFRDCRISDGFSTEEDEIGVGLVFLNQSSGAVKNCEIDGNAEFGIAVLNQAKPELIENNIHDNGKAGIYYQIEENGGLARRNELDDNGTKDFGDGTDIFVFGAFSPILESNSCSNEGAFLRSSPLGNTSGIHIISRDELPAESNLYENKCPVLWCSTPTGSLLSMTCDEHR